MAYPRGEVAPYAGRSDIKRESPRDINDYVKDGKIYSGGGQMSVMVTSQSDLANLEGYTPGTIAYTAGFGGMWQLKADGTWADCMGGA